MENLTSSEDKFIIDNMVWSFSRLDSFYDCPYEWYQHYVLCQEGENGFYGEYGSFMHLILEKYLKGELSIFELNSFYEENFDKYIVHEAPPNKNTDIRESYYKKGEYYLNNIDIDLDKFEILGVEQKIDFELEGKQFTGIIDALLREKETDKIIILDHKSSSIKLLKNGEVSKKDSAHMRAFIRQICLYSIPVIKEYGRVNEMWWNFFKDRRWVKLPWTEKDFNEAIEWAEKTIDIIENEQSWFPSPDFYYCSFLCSQRNNACEYKS